MTIAELNKKQLELRFLKNEAIRMESMANPEICRRQGMISCEPGAEEYARFLLKELKAKISDIEDTQIIKEEVPY